MDAEILAERLKEAAVALGLECRACPPESEGGLVVLRGRRVVFVPRGALAARRIEILAGALAPLDVESLRPPQAVLDAVERARRSAGRDG